MDGSVKRRASKILDEYGAAQSEIGKAVVLTDGKQAPSRTFGWMNCTGFGFPSQVMMEWPVSTIKLAES